ncbi:hypothetical protein [Alkalibacillus almallahensis]|uniref:hypothetical protein n=1 Tax=Alkalibacillus almallahensis TaxID=1379154 RepID=UPI0014235E78|nr:hypothetical protein [Alkalibacillus almallahensis]NIK11630.1 Ca2+/Na+ antiporter [Alkalibacillus almallahensis]
MEETDWDIEEVKQLKTKQLIQFNLLMLLLFVLIGYFAENGNVLVLHGMICLLSWIVLAVTLYILTTGKFVGTKTNRRVQKFDRTQLGEERWRRRKIIELVFMSLLSVIVTVLTFVEDYETAIFNFPIDAFPFMGAWLGLNIGEMIRIHDL